MVGTGTTPTAVPLFGRLASNGDGTFGVDAVGQKSALPGLQLTGTYTVNPDCTGTMTIASPSTTSSAASSPVILTFVLTEPVVTLHLGALNLASYQLHPGIEFAIANSSETASGYGRSQ